MMAKGNQLVKGPSDSTTTILKAASSDMEDTARGQRKGKGKIETGGQRFSNRKKRGKHFPKRSFEKGQNGWS